MSIISFNVQAPMLQGIAPREVQLVATDSLATITTAGYFNKLGSVVLGENLTPTDIVNVIYNYNTATNTGMFGTFTPSFSGNTITLIQQASSLVWYDITCTAAALASTGKVVIQPSSGTKQFVVRNILMNYGAAGLSGGGGNRLLAITDGTTVYNNAGITAALLGTPVNTIWSGTGNPLPGTVSMNTPTVAGANLYAQYSGGTTDFSTGSVVISVAVQRVA